MAQISLRNLKLVIIFTMIFISMGGILTYRMVALRKNERGLSYLNCFSAGMFVSIGFIHMLPEAVEQF